MHLFLIIFNFRYFKYIFTITYKVLSNYISNRCRCRRGYCAHVPVYTCDENNYHNTYQDFQLYTPRKRSSCCISNILSDGIKI